MSLIFEIQGNVVNPKPELLLIEPFKTIWERDKTSLKVLAKQEFGYAEFMTSMFGSNPYREYSEDRKEGMIRQGLQLDSKWKPDKQVKKCIEYLKDLQTEGSISYRYWVSNKNLLEKQIDYFENLDPGELNLKTGNPIYKPVDIPNAVEKAEKVLVVINNLKAKVEEELYESNKTKGGKTISVFADPSSLK